jgi:hypothetical protein
MLGPNGSTCFGARTEPGVQASAGPTIATDDTRRAIEPGEIRAFIENIRDSPAENIRNASAGLSVRSIRLSLHFVVLEDPQCRRLEIVELTVLDGP